MARKVLLEKLDETGMRKVYDEIELPLVFTLDSMEKWGISVKGEELKSYGEKLKVRIQELEKTIWQEAGEEFNINSPKQLGVILFEKLGLPGGKKTKTGYSTAAHILICEYYIRNPSPVNSFIFFYDFFSKQCDHRIVTFFPRFHQNVTKLVCLDHICLESSSMIPSTVLFPAPTPPVTPITLIYFASYQLSPWCISTSSSTARSAAPFISSSRIRETSSISSFFVSIRSSS